MPGKVECLVQNHSPIQLSQIVDSSRADLVLMEVKAILSMIPDPIDVNPVVSVHNDVIRIFAGEYPGYRACNTVYHDLEHTLETFLALARLMHGAHVSGIGVTPETMVLGLVTALLHDIGYIQHASDQVGTGAKYTHVHISRGADFMESYLPSKGFSLTDTAVCRKMILYTDPVADIRSIPLRSSEHVMVGKMLAVADLLGQMASRVYLEKLLLLYCEFEEAFISDFEDEKDLLRKTLAYFDATREKVRTELDGVDRYSRPHFRARWDIDHDLYAEGIERNVIYLQQILDDPEENYHKFLRRRGIVEAFEARKASLAVNHS